MFSAPDKGELHLIFGRYLSKARKFDSAMVHFQKSFDMSGCSTALFEIANTYASQGKFSEALQAFRAYTDRECDPDGFANMAGVLLGLRRFEEAALVAEKAILLSNNRCVAAAMNLYSALRACGRGAKATRRMWEMLEERPVTVDFPPFKTATSHVKVVCVKWGKKYTWEYVNILYRGVLRHWDVSKYSMQFVCFCDEFPSEPVDEGVKILVLNELKKSTFFWGKRLIFSMDAKLYGDHVIFLDLDTVVTGDISSLVDQYLADHAAVLVVRADGLSNERGIENELAVNTSAMVFMGGPHLSNIAKAATPQVMRLIHRFDHWIEMLTVDGRASLIDPRYYVDFRMWSATGSDLQSDTRLIFFPGDVKPADAKKHYIVNDFWK